MLSTCARWGAVAAAAGLVTDQASKLWLLGPFGLAAKGKIAVTPFFDLVLVWNRGVSYGLFEQQGEAGRWLLAAVGFAGALLFGWFLLKADRTLAAIGYGLIVGGALGNAVDRLRFGAVADLFLLHAGDLEWYVFNLADTWIVIGVIAIGVSIFAGRREIATES